MQILSKRKAHERCEFTESDIEPTETNDGIVAGIQRRAYLIHDAPYRNE